MFADPWMVDFCGINVGKYANGWKGNYTETIDETNSDIKYKHMTQVYMIVMKIWQVRIALKSAWVVESCGTRQ